MTQAEPDNIGAFLSRVQPFLTCTADELVTIARSARRRTYGRGELIYNIGDQSTGLHVVVSGLVKSEMTTPDGGRFTVALLNPGLTFSKIGAVLPLAQDRTAIALERSEVLVIPRRDFVAFIHQHPRVMSDFLVSMSARQRRMSDLLQDMLFLDIAARLAKHLLRQQARAGAATGEDIHALNQTELALAVGASRESVNKCLHQFVEDGLIALRGRRIAILDPAGLRERAQTEDSGL